MLFNAECTRLLDGYGQLFIQFLERRVGWQIQPIEASVSSEQRTTSH